MERCALCYMVIQCLWCYSDYFSNLNNPNLAELCQLKWAQRDGCDMGFVDIDKVVVVTPLALLYVYLGPQYSGFTPVILCEFLAYFC